MGEFTAQFLDVWSVVRVWLGGGLCLLGAICAMIGAVGVLRFPDFYTRTHAASVTDTAATGLLVLGMIILAPQLIVVFKLILVGFFLFMTGPTGAHAAVHAAHVAGLEPIIGKIRTPTPEEDA